MKDGTAWPLDGGKAELPSDEADAEKAPVKAEPESQAEEKADEDAEPAEKTSSRKKKKPASKGLTLEETLAAYVKLVALGQTRLFRYVSLARCFESEPGEAVPAVEGG